MSKENTQEAVSSAAIRQFDLTNELLRNLYKFNLTPTTKLVLLELSTFYNPKHKYLFPKQKTIADRLGISERSVVRAISELVKECYIFVECKYVNHYAISSKMASLCSLNLSHNIGQNDRKEGDKLSHHNQLHEPDKEPTTVGEFKILKEYAIKHGAKNINAYINTLKKNGSDKQIIKDYLAIQNRNKAQEQKMQEILKHYKEIRETAEPPCEAWIKLGEKIKMMKNKNPF